jgi:RES domain
MDWRPEWLDSAGAEQSLLAWRGVEAQHVVSTMRLVDLPQEQDLLEQLLETSKPPLPPVDQPRHYLLVTPFRYSPAHPSRFRPAHARGQWYGAEALVAACAEVAYWRHRFLLDSAGLVNEVLLTEHTFFQAQIHGRALDLMAEPWVACRSLWVDPQRYETTHAVARAAQERALQWLAYESARAPGERCAVVFDPQALSEPPGGLDRTRQTWHCKATRSRVMFTRGTQQRWVWDY